MSIFRSRCRNNIGKEAKLYALPTCPQLQFELNELTARHDCDLVDAKHFHHLVSEMIDDFYGDAVAGRRWERSEIALCGVAQASASISAFSVVFSAPYGSF